MLSAIRHLLIGSPIPTRQLGELRLSKFRALAAFSPDALSSIAYANQEIFLGLAVAGSAGLALSWPIGMTIAGLLIIVSISYFQTIHGYPSGGGAYTVARENLGLLPGLLAAVALLIDYVLTAAVSITAGVAAIASAFAVLWPYRIALALLILLAITLLNLRGIRETGAVMAVPVYLFLLSFLSMLAYGLFRAWGEGPGLLAAAAPPAAKALTAVLVLRAFSSGCTALTGIEAISNGVPAFQPPEVKNAGRTLIAMALLMGMLFVGSIGLTQYLAVMPGPNETILSALARRLLGTGPAYLVVQVSTLLILAVAANTSFAGFPRVAAILSRDGFLPRQLRGLGDRLVFTNGIVLLALAAALLIIVFGGDSHALIPLFAVGAFMAFTLSQSAMVIHWWRQRSAGWGVKAAINGLGALVTATTLMIVTVSKFVQGAWITILVVPLVIAIFLQIRVHYQQTARQLSMTGSAPRRHSFATLRVVVPISDVNRGNIDAVDFARSISSHATGVYIELDPGAGDLVREKWLKLWPDVPLAIVPSPYRSIVGPLLDYLDSADAEAGDGQLAAVVLPELVPAKWWQALLHNQSAWLIKAALLYRRRHQGYQRVIIDVPYHLER
jgi:amino acid transporter